MELRLARILSYLFHPLLMPTYGLMLFFSMDTYLTLGLPFQGKVSVLVVVFLNTALMPALVFLIMKWRKIIVSLNMEKRQERLIPFMVTAMFYFATYIMLRRFYLPPLVYYMIFGSACLIIVSLVINLWWKISIHMLAIGGIVGAFFSISMYLMLPLFLFLAIFILIAGLVGFARLRLDAHTPAQVYAGFITGAFFMTGLFAFLS